MTRFEAGNVVLVRFPFTDLSSTKKRPAVILNMPRFTAQNGDVVVLALTSQPQEDSSLRLSGWKAAGLPKPTWVKTVIGTLAKVLVLQIGGSRSQTNHSGFTDMHCSAVFLVIQVRASYPNSKKRLRSAATLRR